MEASAAEISVGTRTSSPGRMKDARKLEIKIRGPVPEDALAFIVLLTYRQNRPEPNTRSGVGSSLNCSPHIGADSSIPKPLCQMSEHWIAIL